MAPPKKKLFADEQPILDENLLTDQEVQDLSTEINEEIADERKDAARKALKEKLRREARQREGLLEAQERISIDLAPYADRITINGRSYLQGQTYTVPTSLAMVMREIMQRTWGHQSEIDGKSENFYRRQRGARVVPVGENGAAVINTSQLLRA
jgi:hypothetical protein